MAIDLKAILGDTKSSIMSPSEIAQLGLRRKQMKMQQENIEFQKQNSLRLKMSLIESIWKQIILLKILLTLH